MKRMIAMLAVTVLSVIGALGAGAAGPYDSYTYSTQTGETQAVYCPTPYYPAFSIDKSSLGTPMVSPTAMCFDKDGCLYIVDSGANCILVLNSDYTLKKKVEDFQNDEGMFDFFSGPTGIFVTQEKDIYVCDTDNERIIIFDSDFKVKKILKDIVPVGAAENEDYVFLPTKLVVDSSKNIYVLIRNDYQGIVQLDAEGNFISYLGSNKVTYDPITKLWKKMMSKEQNSQMEQFLPVEYTNLSLDQEELIYAVSKAEEVSPIKRLNLSGNDVLIRNGYVDVVGDFFEEASDSAETPAASTFVDIVSDENGLIYALDSYKGRVFVYNNEGFLFYTFGGLGSQFGTFSLPSAIERNGSDILVADESTGKITVFSRTEYAALIAEADQAYNQGRYDESIDKWSRVIERNSNFELAYAQMGKVYLRRDQLEQAMEYFELGNYRGDKVTKTTGYNKAFSEYRRDVAAKWLGPVVVVLVVLVLGYYVFRIYRKRRRRA